MNEQIQKIAEQAGAKFPFGGFINYDQFDCEKFADLIVRECICEIETYQIPVGNSAAGEMTCEWTYDALKEIKANIKEHFEGKTGRMIKPWIELTSNDLAQIMTDHGNDWKRYTQAINDALKELNT